MKYLGVNNLSHLILFLGLLLSQTEILAMDLNAAVHSALSNSPEIRQSIANQKKMTQSAIADSQLSDPTFVAGLMNVPTDSFDFDQEPMTQIQVGLQQSFPKGRSLHYVRQQKEWLAQVSVHQEDIIKLDIVKQVRLYWFDLLFWKQVQQKTKEQKEVFKELLEVTQSLLANNKAQQHDVVGAQLELSELDVRLTDIEKNIGIATSHLKRWIGYEHTDITFNETYPQLPKIEDIDSLKSTLQRHPTIAQDHAYISSANSQVKWACEQYKPGITAGITYGIRQGRNLDHSKRPDFVSAMVKMDLPIFAHNRQDRRVEASKEALIEYQEKQSEDYKNLTRVLEEQYTNYKEHSKNLRLYQELLVPKAHQYSQATLLAYKNGNSDFTTLARSFVKELDANIATLKTRLERDKAHINLLYLMENGEYAE